ncbi:hypothetical protein Tco_0323831 [Tanacetum coccineum]
MTETKIDVIDMLAIVFQEHLQFSLLSDSDFLFNGRSNSLLALEDDPTSSEVDPNLSRLNLKERATQQLEYDTLEGAERQVALSKLLNDLKDEEKASSSQKRFSRPHKARPSLGNFARYQRVFQDPTYDLKDQEKTTFLPHGTELLPIVACLLGYAMLLAIFPKMYDGNLPRYDWKKRWKHQCLDDFRGLPGTLLYVPIPLERC